MNATKPRILAIDDDTRFLDALIGALQTDYEVTVANDETSAMRTMSRALPDLVLLDFNLPRMSGLELLNTFKRRFSEVPIIMLTGEKSPDTIIETMKGGASDYVVKGADEFEANLKFRMSQALEKVALLKKYQSLQSENSSLVQALQEQRSRHRILGISERTLKLKNMISRLAGIQTSVLVLGENGTGKELVASELHSQEGKPAMPFIAVNCAAIPEALFESEFFGHVKGAFSGADFDKDGKFKAADGGIIFLDEIGEVPLNMQAKFLRVLQEQSFTPVGSNDTIKVNLRVVAATNRDLETEVREGRFREDLYYRLKTFEIHVPPLRERRDDIVFLAEEFLRRHLPMGKLSEPVKLALLEHSWPGNIRELSAVIERAVVYVKASNRPIIKVEHLELKHPEVGFDKATGLPSGLLPTVEGDLNSESFARCMAWMERQYLKRGLDVLSGDNETFYQLLGVSRSYYFKRKKMVGLAESPAMERSGS